MKEKTNKIIQKIYSLQFIIITNVEKFKQTIRTLLSKIDKKYYIEILKNLSNRRSAAIIFCVLLEYVDEKYFITITEKNSFFKRLVIDYTKDFIQTKICIILLGDNDPLIREKAKEILKKKGIIIDEIKELRKLPKA